MAVTLLDNPTTHQPAYNPQWFVASSTQIAQPNFKFRVVFTDVISGETVTKDYDKDPDNQLQLDAGCFAEQFITQLNPSGLYGWQRNTGAIRKIRVNIGEVYGATPTYYAGSNFDYIVWNGAIDVLEFQAYDVTDYLYSQSNNIQIITNNKNPDYVWATSTNPEYYSNDEDVAESKSSYLYFLSNAVGDIESITVVGFNAAGSQLGSTVITNPYAASSTYTEKYVFIDVGYDGLLNMPSAQISSGTDPIPVSTYAYWIVYDSSSWLPQTVPPAEPYIYPLKRFNKICEPRYDVTAVHYLAPEGAFETQVCAKLSLRKHATTKTYYSKLPYYKSANQVVYDYGSSVDNTLSSTVKSTITVHTDWLEEYEATQLRDAISAPIIYADFGDTGGYVSMKMITGTYDEKRKYNEQLISVSFDLEYSHVNIRQRG